MIMERKWWEKTENWVSQLSNSILECDDYYLYVSLSAMWVCDMGAQAAQEWFSQVSRSFKATYELRKEKGEETLVDVSGQ